MAVDWYGAGASLVLPRSYAPLVTPTYDGSGQAMHPSVLYFGNGWHGYKWWMVMTPLPAGAETYEDPSILVSNDGQTWTAPPGLSNPIIAHPTSGWYNDPNLSVTPDGTTLQALFGKSDGQLFLVTSTDGVTWSAPLRLAGAGVPFYSPSLVHDGTNWVLFYDNAKEAQTSTPFVRKAVSALTQDCFHARDGVATDMTWPASDRRMWHGEVRKVGDEYHCFKCCASSAWDGTIELYFTTSTNGINWNPLLKIMPAIAGNVWDCSPYRASGVLIGDDYHVFYSAQDRDTTKYWTGHADLSATGDTAYRPHRTSTRCNLLDIAGLVDAFTVRADGSFRSLLDNDAATITGNGGVLPNVRLWNTAQAGARSDGYCADFTSAVVVEIPSTGLDSGEFTLLLVGAKPSGSSGYGLSWKLDSTHYSGLSRQATTTIGSASRTGGNSTTSLITGTVPNTMVLAASYRGYGQHLGYVNGTAATGATYYPNGPAPAKTAMPATIFVGRYDATQLPWGSAIHGVVLFDRALTPTEHTALAGLISGLPYFYQGTVTQDSALSQSYGAKMLATAALSQQAALSQSFSPALRVHSERITRRRGSISVTHNRGSIL